MTCALRLCRPYREEVLTLRKRRSRRPQVLDYMRNKTADYGRWIGDMRKLSRRYEG